MAKRNIFDELNDGFDALEGARAKKLTLRTHKVAKTERVVVVTAEEILALRGKLNCSRGVFAAHMRVNERTLEGWEQGRTKPNPQASLLLRMVEQFPDTFERLEMVA